MQYINIEDIPPATYGRFMELGMFETWTLTNGIVPLMKTKLVFGYPGRDIRYVQFYNNWKKYGNDIK